jgi:hypothetical protein
MLADLDNMTVEELAGRLRVVVAAGIEDAADGVAADGVVYCSWRSSRKLIVASAPARKKHVAAMAVVTRQTRQGRRQC